MKHMKSNAIPRHLSLFLLFSLLSVLLLLSWVEPPTAQWWDALDHAGFYFLNGWVESCRAAQVGWALTNHRLFDLLPATLLLFIWYRYMREEGDAHLIRRAAEGIFLAVFVVALVQIFRELTDIPRDSPSLVLGGAHRLSQLVPWADTKDNSMTSFPGDHATVILLVSIFMLRQMGWQKARWTLIAIVIGTLPRLVGGAHWITDVVVGGGHITLAGAALLWGTPLPEKATSLIQAVLLRWRLDAAIQRVFNRLPRL
jgi:membrane-associated phospholipid phosphatase